MTRESELLHRTYVEVTVSAPADEVWRALRDPAQIAQWFGWDAETLPDEIDYIFAKHAHADDAARTIQWDGQPDRFEVEARGELTVVRVVRAAPAAEHVWDDVFEDMTQGWISFVYQLKLWFDRARAARRTIFLSGRPREGGPLAAAALGLAGGPPGSPYRAMAPFGDELAGRISHQNRFQLGVTVDAYGDGLIVIIDRPPGGKYPTGASMVTITTFGLADAAFTALESRWRAWWDAHFVTAPPPGSEPPA